MAAEGTKLFIDRYTDKEIKKMLKSYSEKSKDGDFDWDEDLGNFLLAGGRKRGVFNNAVRTPPKMRYTYRKSYEEYAKSDMPFSILKEDSYNHDICIKYFLWRHIVLHILEVSMSEVPLYLHSKDKFVCFFAEWRLKCGK